MMDQTTLRLILLALGGLLVAGIYLWDRYGRKIRSLSTPPEPEEQVQSGDSTEESLPPDPGKTENHPNVTKTRHEPFIGQADLQDNAQPPLQMSAIQPDVMPEESLVWELDEEKASNIELDSDTPRLILQLHIVTRAKAFDATHIHQAANSLNLRYGDKQIYHRLSKMPDKPLFSLANMLEPGILPVGQDMEFTTPGLILFTELPGIGHGAAIYREMLFSAHRLADLLGADLQDESHSALTKQTIEYTYDRIQEHQRQIIRLKKHRNTHESRR